MKYLHIKPHFQTPKIEFNSDSGRLLISGKIYPADALEFFKPLRSWVGEYVKKPADKTILTCEIEYLNSASQKQLVELLRVFKVLCDSQKELVVRWKYEEGDDDILSVGELIEHELEIPFEYEEIAP